MGARPLRTNRIGEALKKNRATDSMQNRLDDEKGSILIIVIMALALLTVIAFTATRTSIVEVQISTNELLHQKYFYAAEAGIDHVIKLLEKPFVENNASKVVTGSTANWNFAFLGADQRAGSSDDVDGMENDQGDPQYSARWIEQAELDGVFYQVVLWNNDESAATGNGAGGDFDTDGDGLVWVRSRAWHPRGGQAVIDVLLHGETSGKNVTGYTAQAGAGAGKNYNANDVRPITEFRRQP